MIKLSICLPVYNQAPELKRLLSHISFREDIEVIVKDDSTNDECAAVCGDYNVRYFHGEKKGVDKALLFLLQEAKGEYIWFIGDDDIKANAVDRVLEALKCPVSFLFVNGTANGKQLLDLPDGYVSKDKLLEEARCGLGFISSCIFKKDMSVFEEAKKYIGSEWVSLFLVFNALHSGNWYYIREPLVTCYPRTNEETKQITNKGGRIENRAFDVFGIGFADMVNRFPFPKKSKRNTIKKTFGMAWRGVLVGAAGGWDTTKGNAWKLLKHFYSYPESYIAFILFLIPEGVYPRLYSIYRDLFRNDLQTSLIDKMIVQRTR